MPITQENKIIKIGTLYYLPVNQSMRSVTLEDFPFEGGPDRGQMRMVTTSGHDQLHDQDGNYNWVVVEIPAQNNGDLRSEDDILRELDYAYNYLYAQELTPHRLAPRVVDINPFKIIMAPA